MARVFIIEPPTVNVDPAQSFGDIEILFPEGVGLSPLDTNVYTGMIIEKLESLDYNPQADFIAVVGPLISTCVAIGSLVNRYKAVKGLLYNAVKGEYVLRTLGRWQYVEKWKVKA